MSSLIMNEFPDPLSSPSISDFKILCRICLKKGDTLMRIQPIGSYVDKLNPEKELDLYEKIKTCSGIKMEENEDLLPNNICDKCVNLLLIAHYFTSLCAASDKILRNILITNNCKDQRNNGSLLTKIKIENDTELYLDKSLHKNYSETSITNNLDNGSNKIVYICDVCQQEFSDKSSLSDHINTHNYTNKTNVKDSSSFLLSKHSTVLNGSVKKEKEMNKKRDGLKQNKSKKHEYVCKNKDMNRYKKKTKAKKKNCLKHIESNKHENNNITKVVNKKVDSLETKQNVETIEFHECLLCKKSFKSKEDLSIHNTKSHDVSRKFKCYGCDVAFDKYSERTLHEQYCPKMPSGAKYQCRECKTICKNRLRYDAHIKLECQRVEVPLDSFVLEPLLKCPHCELTTTKKSTLKNHILNRHTEDKPFVCEICGKGYAMASKLNGHRKQSHTTERKYKCTYCPYAARQQSTLIVHTRRHTLDYRFSCEICGVKFLQSTGYHLHMKRFHREKEHQCMICKKMFSVKADLKKHAAAAHLGLKPHQCKECGVAYARKRSLKFHLLRAHNILMEKNALFEKVVQVPNLNRGKDD